MVNLLHKLWLHSSASTETRNLSIELMQVIFDWKQKAAEQKSDLEKKIVELKAGLGRGGDSKTKGQKDKRDEKANELKVIEQELAMFWRTPLPYRENVVSYLVRLTTAQHDNVSCNAIIGRALGVLRQIAGPDAWKDVTVKLHFGRMLEKASDLRLQ